MKLSQVKSAVKQTIRENFKQSLSEVSYDFGKKQYTDKNMTPVEILDLAMAYSKTPIMKLVGNKHEYRIRSANDLAKLTGTTQLSVKVRGKQPALIIHLLKNGLVSKEEYANLYKELIAKQIEVIKKLENSAPENRNSGGAARAAMKDMKGEFEESVNEGLKHLIHVETPKEILSKSVASQIMALAKKGVRSSEIGLNMGFVGNNNAAVDSFQKVKNKIYFSLDKRNESVNESFVKGKTYGGTKCEGGCFIGKQGLMKIIKISKESPNNTFIFRQDNFSGLQPHFIKNGVIGKATTLNPSYDLDRNKVRNLKITNDIILSIQLFD